MSQNTKNTTWGKEIPKLNKTFLLISLVFVFGLDLIILINTSFSLLAFWQEMLAVLGLFLVFYYLEKNIFSKKFRAGEKPLDKLIYVVIIIRNVIILLNFIPFVQLAGIYIGAYAAIPYVLIYSLLIWLRYNQT